MNMKKYDFFNFGFKKGIKILKFNENWIFWFVYENLYYKDLKKIIKI